MNNFLLNVETQSLASLLLKSERFWLIYLVIVGLCFMSNFAINIFLEMDYMRKARRTFIVTSLVVIITILLGIGRVLVEMKIL